MFSVLANVTNHCVLVLGRGTDYYEGPVCQVLYKCQSG